MAEILELIEDRERLGVCFDTCHAFAAGYDFRTPRTYRKLFEEFDKVIGLNRLKLFHVNDSRKDIGSRIDRHEHPGVGFIGLEAFSFFLNDPRFAEIPFLLETPKGKNEEGVDHDVVNLGLLKNLCRGTGE
jgi:deoxyribonuclease-4